jgi:glycosyltransferase involved in cell wall biosynthesis
MQPETRTERCVIFVPFIDAFGGVERLVIGLSRYLTAIGRPHAVVTFSNQVDLASHASWPIEIVELSGRRNPIAEGVRLRRWMNREVRRKTIRTPVLAFDLKGAFYSAFLSLPYAVHLTDPPSLLEADISKNAPSLRAEGRSIRNGPGTPGSIRAEIVHRINRLGMRRARAVITMTKAIASEVKTLYQTEASIVPPGVSASRVTARSVGSTEPIRFLSISRLVESKRIHWIIGALKLLESTVWKQNIRWTLEIIGDGPERTTLSRMAREAGLEDRVSFSGRVPDDDLERAYSTSSIFLMPAAQGWGLPAAEALSRRLPVVLHADSGIAEILEPSPWVEIARDKGGRGFASAIQKMVTRVRNGSLETAALPPIPTDTEWAAAICAEWWRETAVIGGST